MLLKAAAIVVVDGERGRFGSGRGGSEGDAESAIGARRQGCG